MNLSEKPGWIINVLSYLISLAIIVTTFGAIPFYAIPDLLQVLWGSGFSESFVNAGIPAVKAINFGLPNPPSMSNGLVGSVIQSFFIRIFDLHAADAYDLMAIVLLALALWGAIRLCQKLGTSIITGSFLSLIYLTLPVIWWHSGFWTLSFGFALLPFYLFACFELIYPQTDQAEIRFSIKTLLPSLGFLCLSLLAVFLDGYSFVMFFSAAGIIWLIAFIKRESSRKSLLIYSLPTIFFSAALSYFVYSRYVGISTYDAAPLSFFRGWSIDLTMLIIPTKGVSWLWDSLGLSVARSAAQFFGDRSVWSTTFALPLILAGGAGFILSRKNKFALPLLLISIFSLYLSLGPSLKVNSLRPVDENGVALVETLDMPAELAVIPTGSAFISENVPGFSNMRAAYRWSALMFSGLFGLFVLLFQKLLNGGKKYQTLVFFIALLLIAANLPNIPKKINSAYKLRNAMMRVDSDLVEKLNESIGQGKTVFFAPPDNDFVVGYLASMGDYFAYNVGGDKNVAMARHHWPEQLLDYSSDISDPGLGENISQSLLTGISDVVVLPYFDTLSSFFSWPPKQAIIDSYRTNCAGLLKSFHEDPLFKVHEEKYFAVISLVEK